MKCFSCTQMTSFFWTIFSYVVLSLSCCFDIIVVCGSGLGAIFNSDLVDFDSCEDILALSYELSIYASSIYTVCFFDFSSSHFCTSVTPGMTLSFAVGT